MALIKCPECNKEISDKAKMCIHCGYPLSEMDTQTLAEHDEIENNNVISDDKEPVAKEDAKDTVEISEPSTPSIFDDKAESKESNFKVKIATFAILLGVIFAVACSVLIYNHGISTTSQNIERTRISLQPYLAELGVKVGDRGTDPDVTLDASDEFIDGMNKVYIMGKVGTVTHAFTEKATKIDILTWVSNSAESYNSFKSYVEKLNDYFGSKYVVKSYPDNQDLTDETYVWADTAHKYMICAYHKNDKINIRWYYEEYMSQGPANIPSGSDKSKNSSSSSTGQKSSATTNKCIVSGCGKDGTYKITGLSGKTEYYCYEHYKEMQDTLDYMQRNTKSSTSSKYNGYSDTYNTDAKYRNDVKDIADVYGISEKEVDSKINAVTGGK